MDDQSTPVFREDQRFISRSLGRALLVVVVVLAAYGIAEGAMRGWGLIAPVVLVPVTWLFYKLELTVLVSGSELVIRFPPLVNRVFRLADVRACEARTYRPIREYGGWGVRCGRKGARAYSVRGNRGVQIELSSGESILIGSQRADELVSVIRSGGENLAGSHREGHDPR
jgi:hypothetical protein